MKFMHLQPQKLFFALRILCVFISVFAILTAASFGFCAHAASQDVFDENYNLAEEKLALLSEKGEQYRGYDTTPNKDVSQKINLVLKEYRKALMDLQTHKDVYVRDLSYEINAAYARGEAAGKLSWICYYNLADLKSDANINAVRAEYEGYLAVLDQKTAAEVISAEAKSMCESLNLSIYTKKLKELELESDSFEAKMKISKAVSKLSAVKDSDIFGAKYKEIYDEGKNELLLQRARDGLMAQMRDIFRIIRPSESFNSNEHTISLGFELSDAGSISSMNEAMKKAIYGLTAVPQSQSYAYIFINELNSKVADIALKATAEQKTGDFVQVFQDFDSEYAKASAKDSIRALLFEGADAPGKELSEIEQLFNAAGGRVDACKTSAELSTERDRASFFKKLCDSVSDTKEKLEITLSKFDHSSFSNRISICFAESSRLLEKALGSGQVFVENCNSVLSKANEDLKNILDGAKAERFLLTYKDIIIKSKENLSASDEIELRACITAYLNLEKDVAEALASQINSIVEKYKTVLTVKIRELLPNDALYLDLSEYISNEIKSLESKSIDVFYKRADFVFEKAVTLKDIMTAYRETVATSVYQDFTDTEKESLAKLCKDAQEAISQADASNPELLFPALERVLENTILSFNRISEYARVRISSRASQSLDIQKLLSDAKAKISASNSRNEMRAIADAAIYKINRVLTLLEISARAEKTEYAIKEMKFLTDDQKTSFASELKALKTRALDEGALAENVTVLSFIWNTFTEQLTEIFSKANLADLTVSKESYTTQADSEINALVTEIRALGHLSTSRKDAITSTLSASASKFKSELVAVQSSKEAGELYKAFLEDLNSIKLGAIAENLTNYKAVAVGELEKLKEPKANYSAKNYEKLLAVIEESKSKLGNCASVSECSALLNHTKEQLKDIDDLLDDAKNNARDELNSLINIYRSNLSSYSKEKQSQIESIYSDAIANIESYSAISEIGLLSAKAEEYYAKIKAIKKDRVYSSSEAQALESQSPQYPLGYDFQNGYWGALYSPDSISFDTLLSIKNANVSDIEQIQSLIRKAAKKGAFDSSGLSKEHLKLLKKGVVSLAVDINASKLSSGKTYTLQMLLPAELSGENILGIAFIGKNGEVEFYSVAKRGALISADLSHFSNYYIVSEQTVDLTPLLIFLTIFLSIELISLFTILFLRNRRRRKELKMLPASFLYSISPISVFALRVKPQNGVGLAVLLSVSALALACGIAFLAKLEFGAKRKKEAPADEAREEDEEQKLLRARETPRLREKMSYLEEGRTEESGFSSSERESDVTVITVEKEEEAENEYRRFSFHRAEINLDVISESFKSGELVTLDALKQKKLISKKADYVKMLARGSLTKPLIIEAHDFSRAAEKMLTAVGGEAIRIK